LTSNRRGANPLAPEASGIRAIWNFAPVTLELPDDVIGENLELFTSLSLLLRRFSDNQET